MLEPDSSLLGGETCSWGVREQKVPPIQIVPALCPFNNFFLEVQGNNREKQSPRESKDESPWAVSSERCRWEQVQAGHAHTDGTSLWNTYLQVRQTQKPIIRMLLSKTNLWRSSEFVVRYWMWAESKTLAWQASALTDFVFTVIIVLSTNMYSMNQENSG